MRKKNHVFSEVPQEAVIEKFSHDARGIARINGKITFIENALPHEKVLFQYTRKKKDFDEAKSVSIISASKDRVSPLCPHYQQCGGCSLQHLSSDAQIEVKQAQLLDLLLRIGHAEPLEVAPPLRADVWHYRHKARLSVRWIEKKQILAIGFRERHHPGYVALMQECPILSEKVGVLLPHLNGLIVSLDAKATIAQIEVAVGDDIVALILRHLESLSDVDIQQLEDFAHQHHIHLFLQPKGPDSIHLLYPKGGENYLSYTLPNQNLSLLFHPLDFTQVNVSLNQKMVTQALQWLDLADEDIVLDLFCGLGNFSLALARSSSKVVGVEGHDAMVQRASMNAERNQINNTTFICADLNEPTSIHTLEAYKANKIVIDPPRAGAQTFVEEIHVLSPEYLLYVSCDPATLARDTRILVHEKGYQLLKAGVMDMFPHTAHVEAMALFKKRI